MNVFVLSTGRCGSTTFVEACKHISNYTAAHESRSRLIGDEHFEYPQDHIEADNRLSWFLGRLERAYGDNAIYVHLKRNVKDTAESYSKRYDGGIMRAYRDSILCVHPSYYNPVKVCADYCHTVNSNIEAFLRDKTNKMTVCLETANVDFEKFWRCIGAEGRLSDALSEWGRCYNATDSQKAPIDENAERRRLPVRIVCKATRIVRWLPYFLKNV